MILLSENKPVDRAAPALSRVLEACRANARPSAEIAERFPADSLARRMWEGDGRWRPAAYVGCCEERLADNGLLEAVNRCHYADNGIWPSHRIPLPAECLDPYPRCFVALCGSYVYGIDDQWSDCDLLVVGEPKDLGRPAADAVRPSHCGPHVRFYTPAYLVESAMNGERHAWEILCMPQDCVLQADDAMCRMLANMREHCEHFMPHDAWREASQRYWRKWGPMLYCRPESVPDPTIRQWREKYGWAHKLAYYLLLDFMLAEHAVACGKFDCRYPSATEQRKAFFRDLKSGLFTQGMWESMMTKALGEEFEERCSMCV